MERTLKKICLFLGVASAWAMWHFYDKNILVSILCAFVFILLMIIDTLLTKRIREKEFNEIESYFVKQHCDIFEKERRAEFIKKLEEIHRSRKF